jgi:hypothetical protein
LTKLVVIVAKSNLIPFPTILHDTAEKSVGKQHDTVMAAKVFTQ